MMENIEIDKLLELFKKNKLDSQSAQKLYDLLNDPNIENHLNSRLYLSWINSKKKNNEHSDKIFRAITGEIEIGKDRIEKDKQFFDQMQRSKKESIKILFSVFRYAAVIVIVLALGFQFLKRNPEMIIDAENIYSELNVPSGSRISISLSDGTKVWLNSESKLTYPELFLTENREVFLEGEAYFEVAKSSDQKFIVKTTNLDIEVLGTRFNVKSHPEEDLIETTLLEGSIKITEKNGSRLKNEYYLSPNQLATYNKKQHKTTISSLFVEESDKNDKPTALSEKVERPKKAEEIISWRNEELVFYQEPLAEISVKLERWYGKKIIIMDDTLKKETYTGKFRNNETIFQVLEAFSSVTPIEITVVNNDIYLRKKE